METIDCQSIVIDKTVDQHLIVQKRITPKNILYVLLDHPRMAKVSILEIVEQYRKTHLSGRDEKIKIDPLDFKEFLQFKNLAVPPSEEYKYEKYFESYLKIGGYPEYVLQEENDYFSALLEAIIFKDIVYMHNIKNPDIVRDLLLLLRKFF